MARNYAYLVMVNSDNNNNKFYEITENNDGSIDANYGRVGKKVMHHHYESWEKNFWDLKDEKERKGYEDVTALHSQKTTDTPTVEELNYKEIENPEVNELFNLLISSSREFMRQNYTIKPTDISQKMVDEAENDLAELNRIALNRNSQNSLYDFNKKLEELFTDVPRKMERVSDFLARTEADFEKIINREREMLDNVKGNLIINADKKIDQNQTVLEAYGLNVRPVTYKEEDQITTHLGRDYNGKGVENRYVKGFVVENNSTRKAYEDYKSAHHMTNKDVRLFYHGSKVENWFSIVKQGLSLNPNALVTGKMFGQGLYFAPESRKALNYMDVRGSCWNSGQRDTGYCAVYAVALGKCYQPNRILGSGFTSKDLPKGTDSVFASKKNPHLGLRNDEYIVYNRSACTIKYLLEMSTENVREKTYNLDRNLLRDKLSGGFENLIKIPEGVRAELFVERLSADVQKEISDKITNHSDFDRLFVDYNTSHDRISINAVNVNGEAITIYPNITSDDYNFFAREMKKTFVESEDKWKTLINESKVYPAKEQVADKTGITPLTHDLSESKRIKQTVNVKE